MKIDRAHANIRDGDCEGCQERYQAHGYQVLPNLRPLIPATTYRARVSAIRDRQVKSDVGLTFDKSMHRAKALHAHAYCSLFRFNLVENELVTHGRFMHDIDQASPSSSQPMRMILVLPKQQSSLRDACFSPVCTCSIQCWFWLCRS